MTDTYVQSELILSIYEKCRFGDATHTQAKLSADQCQIAVGWLDALDDGQDHSLLRAALQQGVDLEMHIIVDYPDCALLRDQALAVIND